MRTRARAALGLSEQYLLTGLLSRLTAWRADGRFYRLGGKGSACCARRSTSSFCTKSRARFGARSSWASWSRPRTKWPMASKTTQRRAHGG